MHSRNKRLAVIIVCLLGILSIVFVSSDLILLEKFRQLEEQKVLIEVQQALGELSEEQESLDVLAADYANWGETCAFGAGRLTDSTINFTDQTFQKLHVGLILIIDPAGQVLHGSGYDLASNTRMPVPAGLLAHLKPSDPLLDHRSADSKLSGLMLLPDGLMVVASRPILTIAPKGQIRGTLVLGRFLTSEDIAGFACSAQETISAQRFDDNNLPADILAIRSALTGAAPIIVRPLSSDLVVGYGLVSDLYGKPVLALRTQMFRDIFQQGKTSLSFFIVWLSTLGVLFSLGIFLVLERLALSRQSHQEAEARYQSIFENAAEGMFQSTFDGRFIDVNPAMARIFGYSSPGEMVSAIADISRQIYLNPEDRDKLVQIVKNQGSVDNCIGECCRRDGSIIWASTSIRIVRDASGQAVCYEGCVQDITEWKRANDAVEELGYKMDLVLNSAGEGIYSTDTEGKVILINPAMAQMIGWEVDDLLGKSIHEICHHTLASGQPHLSCECPLFMSFRDGLVHSGDDQVFWRKDGTSFPIHYTSNPIREGERLVGTVAVVSDITERKQAEARIRRQLDHLAALGEIDRAISSGYGLNFALEVLISHTVTQLGVDAADILLFNPDSQRLENAIWRGDKSPIDKFASYRLGEGKAGRAALERRTIHVPDLHLEKSSIRTDYLLKQNFHAYFGVPLIAKAQIKGVLEVFLSTPFEPEEEWLDFLNALAERAAIAIDNSLMFDNLQRTKSELLHAYDATIEGWSYALDLRDKETVGHSRRVTELTMELASAAGFSKEELVHVRRGALLHDIGKMGVPDHILFKSGPLSDEEWPLMRKHPTLAYEMLSSIHYLKPAMDIPYCHHEKWDGSGYPRGLKGEEIPLAARLFAVVDVWDALTSERPYREAWQPDRAKAHILALAGTSFDPKVVKLCLEMDIFDGGKAESEDW